MPRITVYVSDELAEATNKWRDQLNLSKIASSAIISEIAKLEKLPDVPDELGTLVATLREQKDNLQSESYHNGFEWGTDISFVEELFTYGDFLDLERRMENDPSPRSYSGEWLPISFRDKLVDLLSEFVCRHENISIVGFDSDSLLHPMNKYDFDEWARGLSNGALAVWKKVKGKI